MYKMITNSMYEKSMAIIFKNEKAVGWMSTTREADEFCDNHHDYAWDFYVDHKNYVNLDELVFMTIHTNV